MALSARGSLRVLTATARVLYRRKERRLIRCFAALYAPLESARFLRPTLVCRSGNPFGLLIDQSNSATLLYRHAAFQRQIQRVIWMKPSPRARPCINFLISRGVRACVHFTFVDVSSDKAGTSVARPFSACYIACGTSRAAKLPNERFQVSLGLSSSDSKEENTG